MEIRYMIALNDALNITDNKEQPFQIKFVTLNQEKKTGGKIIELTNATRVGAKYNMNVNDLITVKQIGNTNHPYPVHTHLIVELNHQKVFI